MASMNKVCIWVKEGAGARQASGASLFHEFLTEASMHRVRRRKGVGLTLRAAGSSYLMQVPDPSTGTGWRGCCVRS
jgi:hypothetical protein